MFVAWKADWGDPRGSLMDQRSEDQQMQDGGDHGRFGAAAGWGDGFADGVDACFSVTAG